MPQRCEVSKQFLRKAIPLRILCLLTLVSPPCIVPLYTVLRTALHSFEGSSMRLAFSEVQVLELSGSPLFTLSSSGGPS